MVIALRGACWKLGDDETLRCRVLNHETAVREWENHDTTCKRKSL